MLMTFFGNTTLAWLTALGIAAGVTLALYLAKVVVVHRLGILAERTETKLDDVAVAALRSTKVIVMVVMGLYAGSKALTLPLSFQLAFTRTAITIGLIQAALWGNTALRTGLAHYYDNRAADPARATSAAAVGFIARLMLWIVIVLMMLDNLGVNITALVASLGIGGIAVALAVQNVLGDLFASLSIVLDKPFVVGDFIIVDKFLGTVEHVGLKTTRLRSLGGEQIVFANGDLLKSRLQNMTRMTRRRVVLTVGVAYATPTDKLRAIPPLLAELVDRQTQAPVTLERAHFTGPSGTAMNFEVIYWVETADYIRFMDVQQEIALQMLDRFRAMDVALAVPIQVTRVHGDDAAPMVVRTIGASAGPQ